MTGASLLVSAILNFNGGLSIVDRNVFFFSLSLEARAREAEHYDV